MAVLRNILSISYFRGACTVDPGYRWYLQKVQAAVDQARRECKSDQVDLIGHSAGMYRRLSMAVCMCCEKPLGTMMNTGGSCFHMLFTAGCADVQALANQAWQTRMSDQST